MDFLSCFDDQCLPDTGMTAATYQQVVVGLELDFAVSGDGALVFSFQHGDAIALDGFLTFVTDF